MFEDVAQMEKEIESFRKNMLASSELVESVAQLITETKKQKDEMSASTKALIKELEACVAQFKADHDGALQSLSRNNEALLRSVQSDMSSEQQRRISEIKLIQGDIKECLEASSADAKKQLAELSSTGKVLTSAFHQDAESVKSSNASQMQKLASDNAEAMDTLHKNIASEQEKLIKELHDIQKALDECLAAVHLDAENFQKISTQNIEQMDESCQRIISDTKATMDSLQSDFASKLQQIESTIKGYQAAAEDKYTEFVDRLERTNVDQIFKEVQDLKHSVQIKFAILMGGVGAALITNIIVLLTH